MNVNLAISKSTAEHLANLELDDTSDVDPKLIRLLKAEYRRRLARYRLTDRQLQKKIRNDFGRVRTTAGNPKTQL